MVTRPNRRHVEWRWVRAKEAIGGAAAAPCGHGRPLYCAEGAHARTATSLSMRLQVLACIVQPEGPPDGVAQV